MNKLLLNFFWTGALIIFSFTSQAQTLPKYWLGNGFNSGQTIITNSGLFLDDGGYDLYHANQNWNVRFCSQNGNPITVDFTGFRTDYRGTFPPPGGSTEYLNYDYLRVRTFTSPDVVAYHDDTPQFSFTAPDGCIRFDFISNIASELDSGWVAEISAIPPPLNNDPCTAAAVPVGNACSPVFYSNKGAFNTTTLGSPPCHEYLGGDIWFSAVVPQSGDLKIETIAGSLNYAIMALYTGSCTSLSALSCVDNPGTMPYAILSGRTPGETIFIRVFGDQAKSGTFGICATDPTADITGFTGPGGVGDSISNVIWLRADIGVSDNSGNAAANSSAVKSWSDYSGNNNDLTQTISGNQPLYYTSAINSMPALKFDGTDDKFFVELGALSAPLTFYTINDFSSLVEQSVLCLGDVNNNNTLSISRETDGRYFTWSESAKFYGPALASSVNMFSAFHSLGTPHHIISLNGESASASDYTLPINTDGSLHVGSSFPANKFFNGNLSEVILFSKTLNLAQEIIVKNYLAAKYAIALSSNDKYNYETTHKWDVAGIGRTNANNIHSKAMSAGIISIGGANDLEDGEFVLFGHDNADISSWVSNDTPSGDVNLVRISREWRVSLSGGDGPGKVNISIDPGALPPLDAGFVAYNVLVDSDGIFSTGAIDYGLINSGDEFVANNVSLSDGDFLTITAVKPTISFKLSESEGLESIERPVIAVELNYALSENSSVEYRVISGTASGGGVDYNLNQDVISFVAGAKVMEIVPLIIEDDSVEIPDENFVVELFNPSTGIGLGTNVFHTYTINDNDMELSIDASDTIIGECMESFSTLTANANGQSPFSYSWVPTDGLSNPNEAITNANPTVTTKYVLSVSDALGKTLKDSVTVEVVPVPTKPVITNSGALEFCAGGSVNLGTLPMKGYLWSNGDTLQNLTISASGDFTLLVRDTFGCWSEKSDTTTVTVNPLPVVTVTDPAAVCSPSTVDLTAGAVTAGSDAGLTFSYWTDALATTNYSTPGSAASGTYYIKGTNALTGCETISSLVTVTVNPLPTVTVTDPAAVCSPSTVDLNAGEVTAGSDAGLTFSYWTDALATTNYSTPGSAASGTYYIKGTNALTGCETISSLVTVTVNPLPTVTVTDPAAVCSPSTVDLTAGEVTTGSDAGLTYSYWTDALATLSYSTPGTATSGTYFIKGTDGVTGCEAISSVVTVTLNPLPSKPSITNTGDLEFCEGNSIELSTANMNDYLWSTGETSQNIIVNTSDDYSVQVQDANLCWSEFSEVVTVTVNALPGKPIVTNVGNLEFCEGFSVELGTLTMSDYLWNNGETTQNIIANTSGNYSVRVKDINACWSVNSDIVTVIVNPIPEIPVIEPAGPHHLITGDSIMLSTSGIGDSYLWSNGAVTQSVYIKESGMYNVSISNAFNCSSLPSAVVEVIVSDFLPPPVIIVNGSTQFCEGESVELSVGNAAEYLWSNGETLQTIMVSQAGSFSVIIKDESGRSSFSSDLVEISVFANPTASSSTEDVSCTGFNDGSLSLAITSGAQPVNVLWEGGESSFDLANLSAGNYQAIITDNNDCSTPISVVISEPDPISGSEIINLPSCPDASNGEIRMDINGGSQPYSYTWSTGNLGEVLYNLAPGTYLLTVIDINNCEADFSITLDYQNPHCFIIPDIITPNNDGKNDDWVIDGLEHYPNVRVEIFDRWGKRVFYSKGYENNWNGTSEGKELPMESYHYIIDLNNGAPVIIGNITIVR